MFGWVQAFMEVPVRLDRCGWTGILCCHGGTRSLFSRGLQEEQCWLEGRPRRVREHAVREVDIGDFV